MKAKVITDPSEYVIYDPDRPFLAELQEVAVEMATHFGIADFKGVLPKRRPTNGSGRWVSYGDGYIHIVLRWRDDRKKWYANPVEQDDALGWLAEGLTFIKTGSPKRTDEYHRTLDAIRDALGLGDRNQEVRCFSRPVAPKVIMTQDDPRIVWSGITFTGGFITGIRVAMDRYELRVCAKDGNVTPVVIASDSKQVDFMKKCLAFEEWFTKFGGDVLKWQRDAADKCASVAKETPVEILPAK